MDYLSYIKGNFNLDTSHDVTCYFTDGSVKNIDDELPLDFEMLCGVVSNNINRDSSYNIARLVGFSYRYGDDYTSYFVSTNKQDFFMFSAYGNAEIDVMAVACVDSDGYYLDIDESTGIENYSHYDSYNPFNVSSYGTFDRYINSSYRSVIFDYSSLHFDNSSYQTETLPIRGENISYYNCFFKFENVYNDDLIISYGAPISDIANSEYERGYSNGYTAGWTNGNDNGYQVGLTAGGGGVTSTQATAFTFIGSAFGAAANLLSIEILPNITLGLCFSIPMTFVLIMTIFKLVRK